VALLDGVHIMPVLTQVALVQKLMTSVHLRLEMMTGGSDETKSLGINLGITASDERNLPAPQLN
jgi:hypothetical protein